MPGKKTGTAAAAAVIALLAGCGGGGAKDPAGGDDAGPLAFATTAASTLDVTPASATLFIDTSTTPPTAATQGYTATILAADGTKKDVTSALTLTAQNAAVGTFAGATFTSATSVPAGVLGITTTVTAAADGATGTANLTIIPLRKSGPDRDFYFLEPFGGTPSPASDVLEFGTHIQSVDVAILQDTTGSMLASIDDLKADLTRPGGIIDGLKDAIPDVGIAIAGQDDYPYLAYGADGDLPVTVVQTITTDAAAAQAAVGELVLGNGIDDPESQIPAMHYILTGGALTWPTGSIPAHVPASGTEGGVDFREGTFRVVVQITDAPWHNFVGAPGVPGDPAATTYGFPAPTYAQLEGDFATAHAKYVGIVDEDTDTHPHEESQALSDATGSNVPPAAFAGACGAGMCCTALNGAAMAPDGPGGTCRLNFTTQFGNGLSSSIVTAIKAISTGETFDVGAVPVNDAMNPGGVDATKFIGAVRAMGEGDSTNGCPAHATRKSSPSLAYDDVFSDVVTGTPVCFEVIPAENTTVPAIASTQLFRAFLDVVGLPTGARLDQRAVLFLVPATGAVIR